MTKLISPLRVCMVQLIVVISLSACSPISTGTPTSTKSIATASISLAQTEYPTYTPTATAKIALTATSFPTPTITITTTPSPLPARLANPTVMFPQLFSLPPGDYIVYDGSDKSLNIISVDGKINVKIPNLYMISISYDGRRMTDGDVIYDLDSNTAIAIPIPTRGRCVVNGGSPDGKELSVFCGDGQIYALSLSDGSTKLLSGWTAQHQYQVIYTPEWSPDGNWVSYLGLTPKQVDLILVESSCLSEPSTCPQKTHGPIHGDFFGDAGPYAWSPDSSQIAIGSRFNPIINVYSLHTNSIKTIPTHVGWGSPNSVAWSPNGNWLAFTEYESASSKIHQVYLIPSEGGNSIQLTNSAVDKPLVFWLRVQ